MVADDATDAAAPQAPEEDAASSSDAAPPPVPNACPTAFSVGPLAHKLRLGDEDGVVWALTGKAATARGRVIAPLYRNVPQAAADDALLHEYLALADTHRIGRAREREMARAELSKRLAS